MIAAYNRFIDYLANTDIKHNSEDIRRSRLISNVTVLSCCTTASYIFVCSAANYKVGVLTLFITLLLGIVQLILFKLNAGYRLCANLYLANTFVFGVTINTYFMGGLYSPNITWYALVDIFALLMLGLTADTYIWVALSVAAVMYFAISTYYGKQFPLGYDSKYNFIATVTNVTGIPLLVFAVASVFERTSKTALQRLDDEKQRSENLLLNILPESVARRLKKDEKPIADYFDESSIAFIDIVGFSTMSAKADPKSIVDLLNDLFTHMDKISARYSMEKIKTIGDCYMAVSGIPQKRADHARQAFLFARDVLKELNGYQLPVAASGHVRFRAGLHCGPAIAGVIGEQKFIYDLWGDAVNIASRMESYGLPDHIHCTDYFRKTLEQQGVDTGNFTDRGISDIKGIGSTHTWLLKV
jgi:class 3 adenylate cyclase